MFGFCCLCGRVKSLHTCYKLLLYRIFSFSSSDPTVPTAAVHRGTEVVAVDTAEATFRGFSVTFCLLVIEARPEPHPHPHPHAPFVFFSIKIILSHFHLYIHCCGTVFLCPVRLTCVCFFFF